MFRSSEFGPEVPWFFVLMEYCDGGDLESIMGDDGKLEDSIIW